MATNDKIQATGRRKFIGSLATGAAAMGIATFTPSIGVQANEMDEGFDATDPEAVFKKMKGKHRMVFDATQPHEIFPFAWPKVFLLTNAAPGMPEKSNNAVVVLRHTAIGYAFNHDLWAKYKLGELFKAEDPKTKKPAERNPFWMPAKGDFSLPGLGILDIGINDLQSNGVQFCVCNMAIAVFTATAAGKMNMPVEEVKKEWMAALIPGIEVVPSGIWAIGRAQEYGCQYCFAG
ncbi:MAG TPA: hypothetical protein VLJ68_13500 [Chitinophagaceae bacterium]|nr:hypothetical protein [Chitinophagaceae bacterium]